MDAIGGPGRQQRRATVRGSFRSQILGDDGADVRNAVLVEAVEDSSPEEGVAGLDMLQQGDRMRGREQCARRELDLAPFRHRIVGNAALSRPVQARFTPVFLLHLSVLEVADEEAIAKPVFGLPGYQVPAEVNGLT